MCPRKREEGKNIFYIVCLIGLLVITVYIFYTTVYAKDEEDSLIKKPSYVYVSTGKPDPFEPFIIKEEAYKSLSPEELKKLKMIPILKTELQRIKLSELKIVAIMKTKNGVLAMVQGPTGKGYIVKSGMGIGTKGGIVDKVIYKDILTPLGKRTIRKIVIKEPFMNKKGKLAFRYVEINMGEKDQKK